MSKPSLHWARMGETTFVSGIWLLYWIHKLLGRWPFRLCIYPVVVLHCLCRAQLRASSMQYLQRLQAASGALGHDPGWRDQVRHVACFAETILDKLLAVAGRYPFAKVRSSPGRAEVYTAAQAGQGGLIVTAHIGCLELCRVLGEQRATLKLNVLVHTRHAEAFNRLLSRLNPDNAVNLLEVSEVGPATAVLLSEKVAAGEFVAIAGDRIPVFASQTVQADFLGYPAPFPVGPWVLANLLKCPVWLLACIPQEDGYLVHFEKLAERVQLTRGQREVAMQGYASVYADALGRVLQQAPYAWFNFFRFWDQTYVTPLTKP